MNAASAHSRPAWQTLFPEEKIPYLIVAPPYTSMSAGIRVLHALCHTLNMIGERAYITIVPQLGLDIPATGLQINPEFCTPIISAERVRFFESQGRAPIVIYPESITGNPLNATHVVRYALNYPGLLGGDKKFDENEICYAYTQQIADYIGIGSERVLFMPASDPAIFYPPPAGTVRSGSCFYASKYRDFHKGKLLPITANSTEITRYQPDSLNKQQIAELFRRSEVFYTYEDTALGTEAKLCGCPNVILPNEFLQTSLSSEEMGTEGVAWGASEEAIAKAKATVHFFPKKYQKLIDQYQVQLQRFVQQTQAAVKQSQRSFSAITLPKRDRFHAIRILINYMHQHGIRQTCYKVAKFIKKFGVRYILNQAIRG